MTKNPFINALSALVYIFVVVFVMNYLTGHVDDSGQEFIVPITILSMFTLSAAMMGYIFLLQPLRMYLDGDKQGGVKLFLHTIGVFAGFTLLALLMLLNT